MQPTDAGRRLAASAVLERMRAKKLYDGSALAAKAGVDPDTVRDFLAYRRWPRLGTLTKLEQTLGMSPGELVALGAGDAARVAAHAAAPASAKTLDDASDVELLMALLARATARLSEGADALEV